MSVWTPSSMASPANGLTRATGAEWMALRIVQQVRIGKGDFRNRGYNG